jgi:hypothetical protein
VANPPGHTSTAGAHGTGSRKVTPDGSARLVSLIPKPTRRLRTVQDQGGQAGGCDRRGFPATACAPVSPAIIT